MSVWQWQTLQVLSTLNYQIRDILHELTQTSCESTLWIGDCEATQLRAVQVWETEYGITLSAKVPDLLPDSLKIEVSAETVLIQGESCNASKDQSYFDLEFCTGRFQSLIPLPAAVQPHTALAELQDNCLTLTFQKAWQSRKSVKVNVSGCGQEISAQTFARFVAESFLTREG